MEKKDPPERKQIVLTADDHKRLVDYVSLLIKIDRRVNRLRGQQATSTKTKSKRRATKGKTKAKNGGSLIEQGSLILLGTDLYFLTTHLSLSNKLRFSTFLRVVQHMVDTIVLTLPKDTFEISDPDMFEPSARWAQTASRVVRGMLSKQNPTKKELLAGIYKPRLTLSRRIGSKDKPEIMLKVELSLPKLLFGNNFDELQRKDFVQLTHKLAETLGTMGIIITPEGLAQAPVSGIHYSKNIPLTDGSTPYHFINKIKEANIKLSLDVNQTDYRNAGHSYKWHCNSYEVAFYDKIRDLEAAKTSSKRSIEKDSELQRTIFNTLEKRKKLEILRMEVRLNKRQKMKSLFKTLGIKSDLTFKSFFRPVNARKVLLHYIDVIESKRPVLLDYRTSSDKALIAALILNNPENSPKQTLQMFGLKKALEITTIRELRVMFKSNDRSWYRLMADVNKVKLPMVQSPFRVIRECLTKFKPLKLAKII